MAFSKDPQVYHEEERKILLLATTETVTIECKDEKEAVYYRHRFYALRKAAIEMYDKAEVFRIAGKAYEHMLTPIVKVAAGLREVTIGLNQQDKRTLYVGRGASVGDRLGTLQNALHQAGHTTAREDVEAKAKAFGEIDFSTTKQEPVDTTLSDLGYGTAPPTPQDGATTELTDEQLITKVESGAVLTPDEMKRLQNMKHGEG